VDSWCLIIAAATPEKGSGGQDQLGLNVLTMDHRRYDGKGYAALAPSPEGPRPLTFEGSSRTMASCKSLARRRARNPRQILKGDGLCPLDEEL
jgi:hypothetical protein